MAIKHYDFIIKGNEDKLCAYLNGYLRGKGVKSGYIFTSCQPFKSHFLKELIKYHGEVVHLICRPAIRPVIRAALKQAPVEYEWVLTSGGGAYGPHKQPGLDKVLNKLAALSASDIVDPAKMYDDYATVIWKGYAIRDGRAYHFNEGMPLEPTAKPDW